MIITMKIISLLHVWLNYDKMIVPHPGHEIQPPVSHICDLALNLELHPFDMIYIYHYILQYLKSQGRGLDKMFTYFWSIVHCFWYKWQTDWQLLFFSSTHHSKHFTGFATFINSHTFIKRWQCSIIQVVRVKNL